MYIDHRESIFNKSLGKLSKIHDWIITLDKYA